MVDSTTSTRQQSNHSLHCTAVQLQVKSKRSRLAPASADSRRTARRRGRVQSTYVSHTTARRKKVTVGLKLYGRSGESNHTPSLVWPYTCFACNFDFAGILAMKLRGKGLKISLVLPCCAPRRADITTGISSASAHVTTHSAHVTTHSAHVVLQIFGKYWGSHLKK